MKGTLHHEFHSCDYVSNSPLGGSDPSGHQPPNPFFPPNPLFPWTYGRSVAEFIASAYQDYRRDGLHRNCAFEPNSQSPDDTVYDLFTDYICEYGPSYRYFGADCHLTQQLARSYTIQLMREEYSRYQESPHCWGLPCRWSGTRKFDNWEFITAWVDTWTEADQSGWHGSQFAPLNITQFLGSFDFTIQPLSSGRYEWTVKNRTDLESGTRIPPVWGGADPEAAERISLEELVWQNPSLLAKPLWWVLKHYPIISILRPRERAQTLDCSVCLGGGTMRQEFHWVEEYLLPCAEWDWNNWPQMVDCCIKFKER